MKPVWWQIALIAFWLGATVGVAWLLIETNK